MMQTVKDAFAYFDSANARPRSTQLERCFRAISVVASCWVIAGAITGFFAFDTPIGSKLRMLQMGCLLIAFAIYSVLFPLYFILREPKDK